MNNIDRKALLESLIENLLSGAKVSDRAIATVLTAEERQKFEEYLRQWQSNRAPPWRPPKTVPRELLTYAALLRAADSLYRRAENCRDCTPTTLRGPLLSPYERGKTNKQRLYGDAEAQFQCALELLTSLLEDSPRLRSWLDRSVPFGRLDTEISADPESVPRLVTSRSRHAQRHRSEWRTKRSLQIYTLQSALSQIDYLVKLDG